MAPQRDSMAEFSERLLGMSEVLTEHTAAVKRVEQKMDRITVEIPLLRVLTVVATLFSIFAVGYSIWSRNDILEKNAIAAPATFPSK